MSECESVFRARSCMYAHYRVIYEGELYIYIYIPSHIYIIYPHARVLSGKSNKSPRNLVHCFRASL